jgi:hypothetical protein
VEARVALFANTSSTLSIFQPCLQFLLALLLTIMPKHHLAVGTWTPPGAIFTFEFDDESLELKLVKRTEIPQDEPISWITFSVRIPH